MRFHHMFLAAALAACAPVASANFDAIRFDQALQRAVASAPTIDARRSQVLAAGEDAARASALPDPKLIGGIDNLTVTGPDAFDLAADDMTMKRIGISQDFPAPAKRRARQAVADRMVEQAQALTVAERQAVRRSTAQAWIALWAAEREAMELRALRQQAGVAVDIAKARLRGGAGSAVDAMAVQAEALEQDNRIAGADAAVEAARAGLARWLDVPPDALDASGDPPDLFVLRNGEPALLAHVDAQAPLAPWASREAVAEAEVALASAEKKPDWSVAASYGQRSGGRSDMLTLEFSIDLPIFAASRQDHGVAARRADLDAVAASHEDARRAQLEAVRRLLAEWNGLKRQVERKEAQMLPLARDRSATALAAYRGGGDLQPWLQARRDEIELHIEHARHLGDLGRAWAALDYLLPAAEATP